MNIFRGFIDFYSSRLRRNFPGFIREFYPYLILSIVAAALDLITTCQFMLADGVEDEVHPVIRFVSVLTGPIAGPVIGKVCQLSALVFLTIIFRPWARIIFIPVIVIYLYAAWYNAWGVRMYAPLFLRFFP
jgi:hypothetical protein